ncbi:MAG TPA: hypothetical protein VEB86_17010 [Chryseosolibacter sp.]|nr:hypothetical protein [Chryseosolibacter sp.]
MKKHIACLLVIAAHTVCGQSYRDCYGAESRAAVEFFLANHKTLDSTFRHFRLDPVRTFSIVAPEVGHYMVWYDVMETAAMKLFYCEMGADYSDFSIGYFQMKVSFIEKLEMEIGANDLADFAFLTSYPFKDEKMIRCERVRRMETLYYQSCYLAAFVRLMEYGRRGFSVSELAVLYNCGFWESPQVLAALRDRRSFPSKGRVTDRFPYHEVASYYHELLTRSAPAGIPQKH